jgi:hypothetical protein
MKRQYLYLLTVFSLSQACFGQIRLSSGIETGVSISGLPRTYRGSDEVRKNTEKIESVARPVLGIWSQATYKKHFFIGVGVQYHQVGSVEHWRSEGRTLSSQTNYQSDSWKKMTFARYAFPITMGYNFSIRKLAANAFVGYKPVYYTTGNYVHKETYREGGILTNNEKNKVDPFDHGLYHIARRNQKHLLVGLALNATDKLSISLSYSPAFSQIYFQQNSGFEVPVKAYSKSDYAITIRYELLDFSRVSEKIN